MTAETFSEFDFSGDLIPSNSGDRTGISEMLERCIRDSKAQGGCGSIDVVQFTVQGNGRNSGSEEPVSVDIL